MPCPCPEHCQPPRPAFAAGETDFVACPECGLAFRQNFPSTAELDAIYRAAYAGEKIAGGETGQESGDYATAAYADFLAGGLLQSGMRVLDFGAGSGALVARLRQRGIAADGLEFSATARAHARCERGLALFDDLAALPAAEYDAIIMIEVIEHLTELGGALRELRRATRPGGSLFVTTPNRRGLRARLQGGAWAEARKPFHLFLFDRDSLAFHLADAGWCAVEPVRFSPVLRPGVPAWLMVRLTQALGLAGTLCVVAHQPG